APAVLDPSVLRPPRHRGGSLLLLRPPFRDRCRTPERRKVPDRGGVSAVRVISDAALAQARARLNRMVGPVVLRVPSDSAQMRALAERLADGELLTVEPWPGEGLTLLDGCGRDTGMVFGDLPQGQEL